MILVLQYPLTTYMNLILQDNFNDSYDYPLTFEDEKKIIHQIIMTITMTFMMTTITNHTYP